MPTGYTPSDAYFIRQEQLKDGTPWYFGCFLDVTLKGICGDGPTYEIAYNDLLSAWNDATEEYA